MMRCCARRSPESLKSQLKIGGRLVIPVGTDPQIQELVRVTRIAQDKYYREDLADVRFSHCSAKRAGRPKGRSRRAFAMCLRQAPVAKKIRSEKSPLWPSRLARSTQLISARCAAERTRDKVMYLQRRAQRPGAIGDTR
jgi:hypothetical protein